MRIVQLNPFHYPFTGGIEHRIHHVSKRLSDEHEVFVVTGRLPDTAPEEEIDGYRVIRLESRYIRIYNPPYIITRGVERTLRELDPDVIDFHYRWSPSYKRGVKGYECPRVFTFHNTFGEGEGGTRLLSLLNDYLQASFIKSFDRIVCVSEFVRDDLEERGFSPQKLVAIPNGVEIPEDVGKEGDYMLFLGRLVSTKGLSYLMKAMKKISDDGYSIELNIAGAGPEENKLRSLVDSLGLQGQVHVLGRVSEERKHRLFRDCRLFVFPSTYESYGIAAAEAMSYGKPVVASDTGGLPEVVGEGGLLVPPKKPGQLAEAIKELLDHDEKRRFLGGRARERAKGFSWDKVARQMEQTYSGVVDL